jgi:hypothetical protein
MGEVLHIRRTGSSYRLDRNVLGLNCPVPWDVPHEDPLLVEPLRELAPALLRFPGGTVANYFNWRTGQLEVEEAPNESVYRSYIRSRVPDSLARHPNGAHMKDFAELAGAVGAEVVLVANLETSTVEDQAEWLESMKREGVLPTQVELGNEFYHAMLDDPTCRARFPDYETTSELSRQYAEAFRRVLEPSAKLSIQASPSRFHFTSPHATSAGHYEAARIWHWDDGLRPESWFDAVTVHPYPSMDGVAGPGARARFPDDPEPVFAALMARVDDGLRRCLDFLVGKVPGKEIWISEWGMGEFGHILRGEERPAMTNAWVHALARYLLTALSYPPVRWMAIHALYGNGNQWAPLRRLPEGGYGPWGVFQLLRLFHGSVNGGAAYSGVTLDGTSRHPGNGTIPEETYADVAAGLFERGGETHLLVQNATPISAVLDVGSLDIGAPARIDAIVTPDLTDLAAVTPPETRHHDGGLRIELPPYSLQRMVWTG